MTKDADKTSNSVHLEGIITKIDLLEGRNGSVNARMIVGTHDRVVNKDTKEAILTNPHRFTVIVEDAREEKAEILRELSKKDFTSQRTFFALDGSLKSMPKNKEDYFILSEPDDFNITEKVDHDNSRKITAKGEVQNVAANEGYAMMMVSIDDDVNVRVKISKEKQPKAWADAASGKIHKGTPLSVDGNLRTPPCNDGRRSMNTVFIDATRCNQITLAKKQTETKKNGPTI